MNDYSGILKIFFASRSPAPALAALCLCAVGFGVFGCRAAQTREPASGAAIPYAGFRASTYGIVPFPEVSEWDSYAQAMEAAYPGSVASFVWIVGNVTGNSGKRSCTVNFPLSAAIPYVNDFPLDQNEEFLALCDRRCYSVWLQVESGDADLVALAGETMRRYKNHPCVRGFGIDTEWISPDGKDGWGTAVSDELARRLVAEVRSVNPRYEVFLKHWDARWMPPTERKGLVFVNDSQGHETLETMRHEFSSWASRFAPSPVAFQIGYDADRSLWGAFADPLTELGFWLARDVPADQELSIIWVDFTLRDVMAEHAAFLIESEK